MLSALTYAIASVIGVVSNTATTGVMQYLSALPTADVNANFKRDSGEAVVSATPQAAMNSARLARHPEGNLFHDENAENVVLFDEDGNALFEEDGVTPLLAKNGIPKRRNSDGNPIDQNGDVIRTLKKDGNGDVIQGDLLLDVNGNLIEGFPVTITDSQVLNRLVAEVADGSPVVDVTSGSGRAVWDSNVGCGFDENDAPLDCPDDTYLHMSSSLNADIIGYLSPAQIEERYGDDSSIPSDVAEQGAVLTYIYPSQLILSSASVYVTVKPAFTAACKPADQGGGTTCYVVPPVETGPMVMRIRYDCDVGENDCGAPDYGRVKGWIVEDKDTGTSIFKTSLNLYLDAPALDPIVNQLLFGDENSLFELETIHNLYSRQVSLDLSGKLDILPDGRLNVELLSTTSLDIDILLEVIGFTGVTLYETEHVYLTVPAGGVNLSLTSEPIKP
ncbi:MAG: hypothetical protein COA42_19205 [Alteromonadaceae bacterium]|nr:MAG: hypothetical protein COA42_19205 [Alteromonadaceae bacterium]